MFQIRNRKFPALILCVALLAALCGCQKQEPLDELPLNSESVARMESLYGLGLGSLIEELEIPEQDIVEIPTGGGVWYLNEPIVMAEKNFTKSFYVGDKFYGIGYRCDCENAEETAEVAEALYLAAVEEYGKAKHGHLTGPGFLDNEGVFDVIRQSWNGGWNIAWVVGEFSYVQMNVRVWEDERVFTVELNYRVLPEEWYHFEPGFKASYALGPTLRSDGDD